MSWQVQEAKQRFSEMLRAVAKDGPQAITRHGAEVAVVVDIEDYRRLTGKHESFVEHLLAFPKMAAPAGDGPDVFDEIEAERKQDFPREVDLGLDS